MVDSGDPNPATRPDGLEATKTDRRRPGRLNEIDPNLIPLLRDPAGAPIVEDTGSPDALPRVDLWTAASAERDDLSTAQGFVLGILLALPLWTVIAVVVYWLA